MATETYDDQKQSEADALRGLEENLASSKAAKKAAGFNKKAGDQPKNTASPENLASAEKTGNGAGPIAKKGGLFSGKKADMALNGVGGAISAKGKNWVEKNRKKLLIGGALGAGVIPLVGLALFLIGLMALPNYAENIAARNLAKVTRAAQKSTQNLMREKNAIASLTDEHHAQATSKYQKLKSKTFERIDRLRPNKAIQNLGTQNYIQYNYEKTKLGRERLVSISFSNDGGKTGQTIRLEDPGFFEKRIHPVRTLESRLDMQRQIATAVNNALKLNNPKMPTVVRAIAVKNFMKNKLGVSLKGIIASRYLGKEPREARITMQQDAYAQIKENAANAFTNTELKEATNDANAAEERCVQDPECVGKTVDNPGEVPAEVADEIDKRVNPDRLSGLAKVGNAVVGAVNPIYDIALPVCLVHDGARLSPEGIDSRSNEAQRTGAMVMSTADQQKDGNAINAEAVGAMNWKLGDTNQSNAMKQAQGEQVNTLANTPSTQASAIGGFGEVTIFNALLDGVSQGAADTLNDIADNNCETLTSIWFGVGVGVLNVVVTGVTAVFSGGGTAVAEITITQALKQAVFSGLKAVSKKVVDSFTTKAGFKAFLKAAYKEGKFFGAVEAATFIAKAIVGMHAFTGNGLAVGESFANDADNGVNQLGNNMNRVNFGGRAMTDAETVESMAADERVLQTMNSEKSTFERYFALDNPNSMLTHVGMDLNTTLTTNVAGSMLTKISSVFNPLTAVPKLFGSLNNKVAYAAGDVAKRNYGNVQFAFTEAELDLIDKTPSYSSPSENEYELDQRGDRDKIEEEYGPCLDETVGKLVGEKWIERNNDTGDVAVDKGKCSPKYMGPNNPDYGDGVFRYRLFRFYEGPLSTLEGIEKPVDPATVQNSGGGSTGGTGNIPNGTTQELAQKILDNKNITFQVEPTQRQAMEHIAKTGRARECGTPAVDPKILGVLLALAEKYKIIVGVIVDGHECDQAYHPKGQGVDINGVATATDKGTTANDRRITDGAKGPNEWATVPLLKTFYQDLAASLKQAGGGRVGQIQCFSGGNKPAPTQSVTYIRDTCNHLHFDLGK